MTPTTWRVALRVALLTFVAASVVVFVAREVGRGSPAPERESVDPSARRCPEGAVVKPGPRVVVYFFHGARRCESCNTIEAWARAAVHSGFPEALRDDRLEWRAVGYEEPGNEHYAEAGRDREIGAERSGSAAKPVAGQPLTPSSATSDEVSPGQAGGVGTDPAEIP